MKILISDKLAEEGIKIFEKEKTFKVDCKVGLKPEELKSEIKKYDALVVRSATKVTKEIINAADNLKVVGRAGVGLDNVDLPTATKKGVVVMNTPGGNTTSTAEHTMSMILALSRNIPQAYSAMQEGRWDRSKFSGVELYGKTLGIIGLGRIGSTVAKFARAFEMKVVAYDPFLSKEVADKKGIEVVELKKLLKESDYISVHVPKTKETNKLISDAEFKIVKKSVRIINCARGGVVDEAALVKALKANMIAGAALDVYVEEPLAEDSSLRGLDNCIITPHLGASTSEAQVNVAIEVAESVRDALLGRGIVNAANFPSVDAETYKILEPYNDLALRMGLFSGQLINGRVSNIKITYSGVINQYKVASVSLSLVNGLLKPVLGDNINFINALDIAKDRGINIEETKSHKEEEYVNCIKVEITTDKESFSVWGTLSGNSKPRIVKVNDVYVEADPDGYMLFITNKDKPGLIGSVGTILAENKINIAGISLGREARNGVAVSVVNIDNKVSEETLKGLKKAKNIILVKLLKV